MKKVKCLVWDLDNTLWDGVLVESYGVQLKEGIKEVIVELDRRGILQSIASKNDMDVVMPVLEALEIEEYFLYPQIHWNSKADSIEAIASAINIGIDTLAFIDDQSFERDEVHYYHPSVLTLDALDYKKVLGMEAFNPDYVTSDSVNRRLLYRDDIKRNLKEVAFEGSRDEFLGTLGLKLHIAHVTEADLDRVIELTDRTNQLNATGYTYGYDELKSMMNDDRYEFYICELADSYGTYGKIGIALLEKGIDQDVIKLMIMSCRVISKGVGTAVLRFLMNRSFEQGKKLVAEFKHTSRNRIMYITYKLMGFEDRDEDNEVFTELHYDGVEIKPYPEYLEVTTSI